MEELMRRIVEKEYCRILGTGSILSSRRYRNDVDKGFHVECGDV